MNFARCEAHYDNDTRAQLLYNYTGRVYGGRLPDGKYITAAGCSSLCGNGVQLYRWRDMAATITTWVLPMMGMLLTAPFVSNAFRKTMQATCRWVGSPIVSLAHVLWNINFLGRCCLVLDLATAYNEYPAEGSEFHKLRDSFYILTVLNQYTISVQGPSVERLIRIALFSNVDRPAEDESLWRKRGMLTQSLRSRRRRGVVPALISLVWFLFCLAVSIEAGERYTFVFSLR